jgi:hypothetical protein
MCRPAFISLNSLYAFTYNHIRYLEKEIFPHIMIVFNVVVEAAPPSAQLVKHKALDTANKAPASNVTIDLRMSRNMSVSVRSEAFDIMHVSSI